jgi:hypothetical protein
MPTPSRRTPPSTSTDANGRRAMSRITVSLSVGPLSVSERAMVVTSWRGDTSAGISVGAPDTAGLYHAAVRHVGRATTRVVRYTRAKRAEVDGPHLEGRAGLGQGLQARPVWARQ